MQMLLLKKTPEYFNNQHPSPDKIFRICIHNVGEMSFLTQTILTLAFQFITCI